MVDCVPTDVRVEGAEGVRMRMLIGPADGAATFHMRHFAIDPGGRTPHHQHNYEHEVLVLSGAGLVRGAEGDRPCSAGDVVWIPANEPHQFVNTGTQPLEFICLIPASGTCTW